MTDEQQLPEEPIGSELLREDPSFAGIVLQFLDGLSDRLTKMEKAIAAADFQELRMAAHQLKGTGGGYGYPALSKRAADLEKRARARVLDECAEALDDLKKLCDRLVVDPQ
ncbi:MAG: Hpt domain-containing protein [Phycisphaerales bacterium]|nr:MAG: Hpt domain-containing protein [Phycisphaerales bacterium]